MFTVSWIFWLFLFAVVETAALIRVKRDDTLSEHVWSWFCLRGKGPFCWARKGVFLLFWAWLTIHFVFGGKYL